MLRLANKSSYTLGIARSAFVDRLIELLKEPQQVIVPLYASTIT